MAFLSPSKLLATLIRRGFRIHTDRFLKLIASTGGARFWGGGGGGGGGVQRDSKKAFGF